MKEERCWINNCMISKWERQKRTKYKQKKFIKRSLTGGVTKNMHSENGLLLINATLDRLNHTHSLRLHSMSLPLRRVSRLLFIQYSVDHHAITFRKRDGIIDHLVVNVHYSSLCCTFVSVMSKSIAYKAALWLQRLHIA